MPEKNSDYLIDLSKQHFCGLFNVPQECVLDIQQSVDSQTRQKALYEFLQNHEAAIVDETKTTRILIIEK